MKVLIDGDSIVYTVGFASQKNIWQVFDVDEGIVLFENESKSLCLSFIEDEAGALGTLDIGRRIVVSPIENAFHSIKVILQKIAARAKANSYKVYLTGKGNFREQVVTIMGYKHNRLNAEKPVLYQEIRDYLVNTQKATVVDGMEADDALSIVHSRSIGEEPINVSNDPDHPVWRHPEECIIAAIDKDLRNIPGKHINFDKRVEENNEYKFIVITEEEGRRTFWSQVLTGDSSDNILGIPGMGPKKADKILDSVASKSEENYFWAVYGAYKLHYGTEAFQYLRYDAYIDTTATFRKREAKPDAEILPEQRLTGTALTMLLENARLLWMLRVAPNAEGAHWWMPPMSWDNIARADDNDKWFAKDIEHKAALAPEDQAPLSIWSEGRGQWFWADESGTKHGKFGTEKKAKSNMKDYQTINSDVGQEDILPEPPKPSEEMSPDEKTTDIDAVHLDSETGWCFWDETWATRYGPYDTEELAREGLDKYVKYLEQDTQKESIEVIDLEYAAGFIDADGCVTKSDGENGSQYWELNIVQSEKNDPGATLLKRFKERWGGGISTQVKPDPNHSDIHKWKVKGVECAIALSDVYSFLDVKQGKAQEALEYFVSVPKINKVLSRLKEPYRGGLQTGNVEEPDGSTSDAAIWDKEF